MLIKQQNQRGYFPMNKASVIIDFHAHTFPEQIAEKAIAKLSKSGHIKNCLDGTFDALQLSMREAGIDYAVLLPVATKPAQQEDINKTAILTNERFQETGILSFGGIHPDNENYRQILRELASHDVRGIKLHPVFQQIYFDDIRYLRIMECACENNLIILTHAGYDVSFPGQTFAAPDRIRNALRQIQPDKLVLAHMGGWDQWDEAEELLAPYPVYLDTAYSLLPLRTTTSTTVNEHYKPLSCEQFLRMVKAFGTDHILFGSDSPWADLKESLSLIRESGLPDSDLHDILGNNAAKLLGIPTV